MRKNRLIWCGHIMKRDKSKAVTMILEINVERKRKRPKNRKLNAIDSGMRTASVYVGDVVNCVKGRF